MYEKRTHALCVLRLRDVPAPNPAIPCWPPPLSPLTLLLPARRHVHPHLPSPLTFRFRCPDAASTHCTRNGFAIFACPRHSPMAIRPCLRRLRRLRYSASWLSRSSAMLGPCRTRVYFHQRDAEIEVTGFTPFFSST
jgi:hypothetical protein